MIDAQLIEDKGILKVLPETALEKEDFERLELMIESWRDRHGPVKGLMIHTEQFPGWDDLEAMLEHYQFVREHHDEIRRVAMVTDSPMATFAPKIGNMFLNAEVRGFPFDDNDRALEWVSGE